MIAAIKQIYKKQEYIMKRILSTAVCVILALAMLASCGGNGGNNKTTTTTVVHAHTYNNTWQKDIWFLKGS